MSNKHKKKSSSEMHKRTSPAKFALAVSLAVFGIVFFIVAVIAAMDIARTEEILQAVMSRNVVQEASNDIADGYNEQDIVAGYVGGDLDGDANDGNDHVDVTDGETNYYELVYRDIAWPISLFEYPNFDSAVIAIVPAQRIYYRVCVSDDQQTGNACAVCVQTGNAYAVCGQNGYWVHTSTTYGDGWVYTRADMVLLQSVTGIFDVADGDIVSWVHPQPIQVMRREAEWLLVYSDQQSGWINPYFEPPIHLLEEFMSQFGTTVAIFYENLSTGFTFSYNGEIVYFGASATKAPFALYIYLKAERGETDLNSVHAYQQSDFWEGSGVIRHRYALGTTFTQHRLLYLMLRPSDNIATRMLRRIHGYRGFTAFVEELGANPANVHNITYSRLSANDAGIFLRAFHDYIMSDGIYSQDFKDNLMGNRYPFVTSDYPLGSKSGWAGNFGGAWHDMALVFAPSPYSLAILSTRAGNQTDRNVYAQISRFVQEFNTAWFYPGYIALERDVEQEIEDF